jgi:lipoprotein-anchoring transpeptidase ErfK/SrfK
MIGAGPGRGRRVGAVVGAVGLAMVLAACSGSGSKSAAGGGGAAGQGGAGADVKAASVAIVPAANAKVAPSEPVVVTAKDGTLTTVTVTGAAGKAIAGSLDGAKTTWTSKDKLAFGTTYKVTAKATNSAGKATDATSSFSTAAARRTAFPAVSPLRGTKVGVGMPIRVYFDAPVADHKSAEEHMTVTSSKAAPGGWHWFSDTEVHYRPQKYWPANTTVALDTTLFGVALGGGVYGSPNADRHIQFTIGDSHVTLADTKTHVAHVFTNGKLVKSIPISAGKEVPGRYTHSGPHVVIEKNRVKTMDSRTFGLALDAGGYTAKVEWATRISNNGEFLHSAPWSVAQQGHTNVSHGCLNASPQNAQWFFNYSTVGDVVDVSGTPVKLGSKDGDIFDWTVPWSQWAN